MNNPARKKDYEESANEYSRWVRNAIDLQIAAKILEDKYNESLEDIKASRSGRMPIENQVLAPMVYMKAKALEILLKSLYLKKGNKIVENGVFMYKSHNLLTLLINTDNEASSAEEKLLIRMTDCITFWGTYPVPTDYRKWRLEVENMSGIPPIYCWGGDDNNIYDQLFKKINEQISK